METSSNNTVKINAHVTPLLFSNKLQYRLSDLAYGEWVIFENGVPKYYFNVFDEQYFQLIDRLKPDAERYLSNQFKVKKLNLSTTAKATGIPLPHKSAIVELKLEKLPLQYLI